MGRHQSVITSMNAFMSVAVEAAGAPLPLRIYNPGHQLEHHVAGIAGAQYAIRVANLTASRIEVITSIDGRNTLKDEEASVTANTGLVIPPYRDYLFRGWRLDNEGVRDFIFGKDLADSVVAQGGGDVMNAGVIGVAAYRERMPPPPRSSYLRATGAGGQSLSAGGQSLSSYSGPVGQSTGATMDSYTGDLSTGIGDYTADRIGTTSFTRAGEPDVITIRYASYEALVAAGIIAEPEAEAEPHGPQAFPGSSGTGYSRYHKPRRTGS